MDDPIPSSALRYDGGGGSDQLVGTREKSTALVGERTDISALVSEDQKKKEEKSYHHHCAQSSPNGERLRNDKWRELFAARKLLILAPYVALCQCLLFYVRFRLPPKKGPSASRD